MYDVLVLMHILSAMVWVGGGFVLMAVERHSFKTGGPEGLDRTMRALEWTDDWIFTPAPLLTIATGVAMVIVSDAWAFSQPWVYVALALIAVEFVTGFRELARIKAARSNGSVSSGEYRDALKAYVRFAPFAVSLLGIIVVLMVLRPGA